MISIPANSGPSSLCLLGQITHYLTPVQNLGLFRRVHAALRPRGIVLLEVPMTGESPSEWTKIVSLLLWVNGGGGTYPFAAYRAWLAQASFATVSQLSERWLTAAAHSSATPT